MKDDCIKIGRRRKKCIFMKPLFDKNLTLFPVKIQSNM